MIYPANWWIIFTAGAFYQLCRELENRMLAAFLIHLNRH